ncbi:MAG: aspartate carbamoyltransferase [Francisellaceae bacterium]
MGFDHQHLTSITQLSKKDIDLILSHASSALAGQLSRSLSGKIVASCFFEASTRTRLSFESAILRSSGGVIGFSDGANTSFGKKGESLADTISMLNGYADAIVMRHPETGSVAAAAAMSTIPVINAGDGANQHPTQTLLDLFTIKQRFGKIDGLKIAMVGDLKYGRTVHSLSLALKNYRDITLYFVAPDWLQMPASILQQLAQANIHFCQLESMEEILSIADVLYMTRLQKERLSADEQGKMDYILTAEMLARHKNDELIVMHPLPRVDEIAISVDKTPHAWYFKQAKNGVFVRQAILDLILNKAHVQ